MRWVVKDERGAALATVLLFMMLTFILVTSMLAATGNEIIIAGMHRDSVQALEYAQAGIQEAIVRIKQGRPYNLGFTSSLYPGVTVSVLRRIIGTNAGYLEIQSNATVGRATRRLSMMVLQSVTLFPPNITFADNVTQNGNGDIISGDAYARTFFDYQKNPTPAYSYAGWWIRKGSPGPIPICYNHAQCVANGAPNWYAGQRRAEHSNTPLGADIAAQTFKCPAGGGGTLPADTFTGILQNDPSRSTQTLPLYGFDTDDPGGGAGPQAVNANLPCGLPYKYSSQVVTDPVTLTNVTVWFKSLVMEQWYGNYFTFDQGLLDYVKTAALLNHPEFGAVGPFPNVNLIEGNYDIIYNGGGSISNGYFGCKAPEMAGCAQTDPKLTLLNNGDYSLSGTLQGDGTLVVNGNLTVDGQFTYYGTIIVNGTFVHGAGNATIYGGLLAQNTLQLAGNFTIYGGGTVDSIPVGPSNVVVTSWWER